MDDRFEQLLSEYLEDFRKGRMNCAETVLITMCDHYDMHMDVCPMIATAFGGGIASTQKICGAISGALMVIGLKHGRELGGDRMPAYELAKRLLAWFEDEQGTTNCKELVFCDLSDPVTQQQFRAPGGAHERVCEPLVADVCRWLLKNL